MSKNLIIVFTLGVILVLGLQPAEAAFWEVEMETQMLFLPTVIFQEPVKIVVTDKGIDPVTQSERLYGYVTPLVDTPMYSVTVGLDTLFSGYCNPHVGPPCDSTKEILSITPAFSVTLPGEINPFAIEYGSAIEYYLVLREFMLTGLDVHPDPHTYHPINIIYWLHEDGLVYGWGRNDNQISIDALKIVALADYCGWKEAILDQSKLRPGDYVYFEVPGFNCTGEDMFVVGQGRSHP